MQEQTDCRDKVQSTCHNSV